MDIIVPVPKAEVAHFWEEVPDSANAFEFWTMSRRPTALNRGDFIHFAIKGRCVARAKILDIFYRSIVCEATRRVWNGWNISWHANDFEKLDNSPIQCSITRGFQYLR